MSTLSSLPLIDTHAHLQDEAFLGDVQEVLARCERGGLRAVINAGTDLKSSKEAIALAEQKSWLWALAGFHPHDAKLWNPGSLDELKSLLSHPKILGIGEIGLDYHYDFSPRGVQREAFETQWRLGNELNMPVIVHLREAFDDFFDFIKSLPAPPKVLLHCFSGTSETAKKAADMGYHFSVGGALTFKKNEMGRDIFSSLPIDVIHLETDCPYLAPVPFRGKRSEPAMVGDTMKFLAGLRKISPEDLAQVLLANAQNFFGPKLGVC